MFDLYRIASSGPSTFVPVFDSLMREMSQPGHTDKKHSSGQRHPPSDTLEHVFEFVGGFLYRRVHGR